MPVNLTASESVLRTKFNNLSKPEDVADLLELNGYAYLEYVLFIMPNGQRYSRFRIPKKRGAYRLIEEPHPKLKIIQQKLLQVLTLIYKPKPSVHGFVQDKSIVTNAKTHASSRYVFNLDLKDFFPSIHFGRVRGMFVAAPHNLDPKVATVLAQICSLRNSLPQGAPTSPIISNMICAKMDSELQDLAKKHRCLYTRYADDITFSTNARSFPKALASIETSSGGRYIECGPDLENIIQQNGFRINTDKVRLQTKNKRQEVTGLTTNKFANVKRSYIREIRMMLHIWGKYGYSSAEQEYHNKHCRKPNKKYKKLPSYRQVMKGKIEFLRMVRGDNDQIFRRLNNWAAQLERDSGLTPNLFHLLLDPNDDILALIANGETMEVEFKEGACLNPHTKKKDDSMKKKIANELAAFMNTVIEGTLLIGVTDNGDICGIEREYSCANPQKSNWDGYESSLINVIKDRLGLSDIDKYYTIFRHRIAGKTICVIRILKSDDPVFSDNKLYKRVGTQCELISDRDRAEFLRNWFGK